MQTEEYYFLIKGFVQKTISVETFISNYISLMRSEVEPMLDEKIFAILEDLFEDIDAYSPMVLPENETQLLISENTLREEARVAVKELEKVLGYNQ